MKIEIGWRTNIYGKDPHRWEWAVTVDGKDLVCGVEGSPDVAKAVAHMVAVASARTFQAASRLFLGRNLRDVDEAFLQAVRGIDLAARFSAPETADARTPDDVREIVESALKAGGFDGLFNDDSECACQSGELFPCARYFGDCKPGYLAPCPDECRQHDYHIVPERPARPSGEAANGEGAAPK